MEVKKSLNLVITSLPPFSPIYTLSFSVIPKLYLQYCGTWYNQV